MRFLTLEECSDSELHCIYHDPERTVTVLHPRTACSLQLYAPIEDAHANFVTFHTRRPNTAHSWWLQLSGITNSQLLGIAIFAAKESSLGAQDPQSAHPVVDRELIRWYLTNIRSIIPIHDVLDEDEHLQTLQPLSTPWSWPDNTFYREARRGCVQYLTEPLIAALVTHGLLLVNDAGIRWKHLDQYILVKIEDEGEVEFYNRKHRPRFEKLDARAFRRERIGRPGLNGEWNGFEGKPPTPIEQLDEPLVGPGEKRVRICAKKRCVGIDEAIPVIEEEDVEENEGKTVGKARRVAKSRKRLEIVWDSQRRS